MPRRGPHSNATRREISRGLRAPSMSSGAPRSGCSLSVFASSSAAPSQLAAPATSRHLDGSPSADDLPPQMRVVPSGLAAAP